VRCPIYTVCAGVTLSWSATSFATTHRNKSIVTIDDTIDSIRCNACARHPICAVSTGEDCTAIAHCHKAIIAVGNGIEILRAARACCPCYAIIAGENRTAITHGNKEIVSVYDIIERLRCAARLRHPAAAIGAGAIGVGADQTIVPHRNKGAIAVGGGIKRSGDLGIGARIPERAIGAATFFCRKHKAAIATGALLAIVRAGAAICYGRAIVAGVAVYGAGAALKVVACVTTGAALKQEGSAARIVVAARCASRWSIPLRRAIGADILRAATEG